MTARAQNLTLVAALIIALVLVAHALREDDGLLMSAASASPSPSLSPSSPGLRVTVGVCVTLRVGVVVSLPRQHSS